MCGLPREAPPRLARATAFHSAIPRFRSRDGDVTCGERRRAPSPAASAVTKVTKRGVTSEREKLYVCAERANDDDINSMQDPDQVSSGGGNHSFFHAMERGVLYGVISQLPIRACQHRTFTSDIPRLTTHTCIRRRSGGDKGARLKI